MNKFLASLAIIVLALNASARPHNNDQVVEDTFALFALDAQMRHKFPRASGYFEELYKRTGKKEYLYQSIRMLEYSNDSQALAQSIRKALSKSPDDVMLKRFEVIVLIKEGKYGEASQKALSLTQSSQNAADHILYAESRMKLDDYKGAYDALQKAYALNYENATAERIALIQYSHLGQKAEAIEFLKKHIGAHGNSVVIGKRLGSLYADSGSLDDAAQIYEQTYEGFKDASAAEEAIKIYLHVQNYPKLTAFLEQSSMNDPLLLDLYVRVKQFDKASKLAQSLYEREDNPRYLAQSVIYKYEGSADRNDPKLLSNVVEGLKKASEDIDDPLFLNYLGYLMIDHDMDIQEGMGYVQRALAKQPESPYYIDSLAWAKYKLGECEEAMRLIKQVEEMVGTEEQEVNDHLKAIKTCKSKEK